MSENQDRITSFWNTVAPDYDSPDNVAVPGTRDYAAWTEAVRSLLPAPPARILDVGTGTGFVARIAAKLGHRVTGTDLSEEMLAVARDKTQELDMTFAVGDAVVPNFPAGSFDVVVNRSLLWTLREPERALANWCHLLSPGGRIVVIYGIAPTTKAGPPPEAGDASRNLFERHYTPETQAALTAMYLSDHTPVLAAADAAGLHDVEVEPLERVRGWEASPGSDLPYAMIGYRPSYN